MDITELGEGFVIATYDIPAPDVWKSAFRLVYRFPFDSQELKDLMTQQPNENPIFWKHFKNRSTYYGEYNPNYKERPTGKDTRKAKEKEEWLVPPLSEYKRKIISSFLDRAIPTPAKIKELMDKDQFQYSLYINKEKVTDPQQLFDWLNYLKGKIDPLPEYPTSRSLWSELTPEQTEHNKLVDDGDVGRADLFPTMEHKPIILDKDRLLYLEWKFAEQLFSDTDEITNPKFVAERIKERSKINGKTDDEIAEKIDRTIPIRKAFTTTRGTFVGRLKKQGFNFYKESVYTLPLNQAFTPNEKIIDKATGLEIFRYNDKIPPAKFVWDEDNGFTQVGTSLTMKQMINGVLTDAPRLPYDESDTFEEIFYDEFLPLFTLIRNFLLDPTRSSQFKTKWEKYDKKFTSFNEWILILRVKPISKDALEEVANSLAVQRHRTNPTLYKDTAEELKQKYDHYYHKLVSDQEKLACLDEYFKNFVELRESQYRTNVLGDSLVTPKTEDSLDNWVKRYNIFVKAYNEKKKPKVELKSIEKEVEITKGQKVKDKQIADMMLNTRKCYYTMPNSDSVTGSDRLKEKVEWMTERLAVEDMLWALKKEYIIAKTGIEPISALEGFPKKQTQVLLNKKQINGYYDKDEWDKLYDKYEELHLNPEMYKSPTIYKGWIVELLKRSNDEKQLAKPNIVPDADYDKKLEKKHETEKTETIKQRKAYINALVKVAKSFKPIEEIKAELTDQDIVGIV